MKTKGQRIVNLLFGLFLLVVSDVIIVGTLIEEFGVNTMLSITIGAVIISIVPLLRIFSEEGKE